MLHMILQLLDEVRARHTLVFILQYDGCLDYHTADWVWHTGDGALYYGWVSHQGILYLERTDAVTRTLDHIVDSALKPEVAFLITPSHIARMIVTIMPNRFGLLFITIVIFEEADRLVVADADANLALFTILAFRHVWAKDVNIILWVWLAHASWLWLDPREGSECHRGLSLSEALVNLNTSKFLEGLCHGWVHCLTRCGAVFKTAEVILREIFLNHEAVDSRRGTERGDVILLNLAHDLIRRKLLVIEDEDGGSGKPLSVELTPYSLAPTGIGYGKVDGILMEIMPIYTRGQMTEGIEVIVCHHLWLASGSRCEVHQQGILIRVYMFWANKRSTFVPFLHPVVETFRDIRTDTDQSLDSRTLWHCLINLLYHVIIAAADNRLHACCIVAVNDVVLGKHVGGRDGYGAQLVETEHGEPPLIVTLQNEHHLIIVTDAETLEVSSSLVALLLQVLVCKTDFFATFTCPKQRHVVWFDLCPFVHHVVGKVEIFWYDKLQMLLEVLL